MARKSKIAKSFLPDEWAILRKALKKKASERTQTETILVRRYWYYMKQAARSGQLGRDRENAEYRAWLEKCRYPTRPFDRDLYNLWYHHHRTATDDIVDTNNRAPHLDGDHGRDPEKPAEGRDRAPGAGGGEAR